MVNIKCKVGDTLAELLVPWNLNREHSRPQRPGPMGRSIHGLCVTLRMVRVKSDKSDCPRARNDYSAHIQRIGPSQRS